MTILLAMSVYLLIVSDILPETSDYVPRLGLYYMCVMGEVALVLTATAVSIRCHFAQGKPPRFLMRLTGHSRSVVKPRTIHIFSLADMGLNTETTDNEKNQSTARKVDKTEHRNVAKGSEKELWHECWMDFARRLDMVFLVLFTILFLVTTLVVLLSRK
jgi:hypothetical protein